MEDGVFTGEFLGGNLLFVGANAQHAKRPADKCQSGGAQAHLG